MLHVRVDGTLKERATEALEAMGLTMTEAVRLFLHQVVVRQELPLELKVPNAETCAAMQEARAMMASRRERFANAGELLDGLEKNRGK
ncbi:MAG: type II toxin-antitoxin system RelB/DinJ family antitoxin [Nitrospirae bacterium]|nr:MAG: type II toxin-antitoxin system RelB/DinJ family antitoxin [Nitrospirota bacterium]